MAGAQEGDRGSSWPRVFLDANVFLYAVGGKVCTDNRAGISCKPVGDGGLEAVTNTEVLQEILHVRARRLGIKDAGRRGSCCQRSGARGAPGQTGGCPGGVASFSNDITVWEHAMPCTPAVMKNGSLHLLVSVDGDFDVLKEIKRLSPTDALGLTRQAGR